MLRTFDERVNHYGSVAGRDYPIVLKRGDVYGVGPPSRMYSSEALGLILSYMEPGATVIDVGCGAAPYAPPLREAGLLWTGCEMYAGLVDENVAAGLPVVRVHDATLPFDDAAFDYGSCIEVLEHVEDFEMFVAEIARITKCGACFSVRNVRAIPRYAPLGVVPWHLLKASHVNFFGATSLRGLLGRHFANVVAFEYGALPIAAPDGTPVFNHVFAAAFHAL